MPFGNDSGLGKSIADVLRTTPKSKDANRGFLEVDLDSIRPPAENPRRLFKQEELEELAASIRIHGILQPLVVLKRAGGYEILSGERRFRAAKMLDLDRVPVVVRDVDDEQQCAELRLIENIQREDLNPVELAQAYIELLEIHGLTQEQLADRLGKKRSSIANSLRLLTLPKELLQALVDTEITMGHAKVLLSLDNKEQQKALALRIANEGLSVRALELLVAQQQGKTNGSSKRPAPAPHIRELEENLQRLFGCKVKVKEKRGKGNLTVFFESASEFQDLIAKMDELLRK
jgi:ParB family transcriptional regulator, chromosome partitioning protein